MIKNVAEDLNEKERDAIGEAIWQRWDDARLSRAPRLRHWREIDRMFSLRTKPKSFPWAGAANIMTPLMTAPIIQHQSRLFDMIFSGGSRLASVFSPFDWPTAWRENSERYFNHYILHEMPEFPLGLDATMHQVTAFGSSFRQARWDVQLGRIVSDWIPLEDFVAPAGERSRDPYMLDLSAYSVMLRWSLRKLRSKSEYIDTDSLKVAKQNEPDDQSIGERNDMLEPSQRETLDTPRLVCRQYFRWSAPKRKKSDYLDGKDHPVIGMIDIESRKLLYLCYREEDDPNDHGRMERETAEYEEVQAAHQRVTEAYARGEIPEPPDELKIDPPKHRQREVPMVVHYSAYQGEGFYGYGIGDFLLGLTKASNTIVSQRLNKATLETSRGGYISRRLRGPRGIQITMPNQLIEVDADPAALKNGIYYPDVPPSDPYMQFIHQEIREMAQGIVGSASTMSGEIPGSNQSAQGVMALIEQANMPVTVMAKRNRISFNAELYMFWRLLGTYLPEQPENRDVMGIGGNVEQIPISAAMFSPQAKIYPVGDARTRTERVNEAMVKFQFISTNPVVITGAKSGSKEAGDLLRDASATVLRALGDEKSAALLEAIKLPTAQQAPPGGPPGPGAPPPAPSEQPAPGGAA